MDTPEDIIQQQYDLEKWWIEQYRTKEVEYIDLLREGGRAGSDRGVRSLLNALGERLSVEILEKVQPAQIGRARRRAPMIIEQILKSIEVYELSYLLLHKAVCLVATARTEYLTLASLATALAGAVEEEIRYRAMVKMEPKLPGELDKILSRSANTIKHRKRVFVNLFHKKTGKRIPKLFIDSDTRIEVGNALMELLLGPTGYRILKIERIRIGPKSERTVVKCSDALEKLLNREGDLSWLAQRQPTFGLTLFEPQPRTLNGGLTSECIITKEQPVIKLNTLKGKNPDLSSMMIDNDCGYSTLLGAISELERTPWTINRDMLAWVKTHKDELHKRGILTDLNLEVPDKPKVNERSEDRSEREQEALNDWKRLRKASYDKQFKARLKLVRENMTLKLAERLSEHPEFYFRWYADFRGRLYVQNTTLSIQGGALSKCLLEFKEGGKVKVGSPTDSGWLELVEYGLRLTKTLEKASEREVLQLADNANGLYALSQTDLGAVLGLVEPKNVLAYVAWALEIQRLLPLWGQWATSGHPIRRDATCSSMQHMAALCGDRKVMELTNVLGGSSERAVRDLYGEIYSGDGLTRTDLKSFIMTYAYNSTDYRRNQKLRLNNPEMTYQEAQALTERVKKAAKVGLGKVSTLGDLLMKVLGVVLDREDTPATSVTLTGFVVDSTKYEFPSKIYSLYSINANVRQRLKVSYKDLEDTQGSPIRRRKTAQGWVANLVHSLDAALLHLALHGLRNLKDPLVRPYVAFIHDCAVTRPGDMSVVLSALRVSFRTLYEPVTGVGVSAALHRLLEYWCLAEDEPELYEQFRRLKAVKIPLDEMTYLFV